MKTQFLSSFERDLRKIRDRTVLESFGQAIREIEAASRLSEINSMKKLSGPGDYYRIRIGEYRLGLMIIDDEILFVRCLNRRDIYKYFP